MKIISLAAATAALALIAAPAFAQTAYESAPSVIGGVVGGVGTVATDVVAVPANVLLGRSAFVPQPTPCTVTGGGAVGTCSSVR